VKFRNILSNLFDGPIQRVELAQRQALGDKLLDSATYGTTSECMRLVAQGADLNRVDSNGSTALHLVLSAGCLVGNQRLRKLDMQLVSALLDPARPETAFVVHKKDKMGNTPLHIAVDAQSTDACQLLLELGSCVNAKDVMGATPLHHAARFNSTDMCTLLMMHGADVKATNVEDRTAADVAKFFGNGICFEQIDSFLNSVRAREAIEEMFSSINGLESPRP
jgi:uncharacterized protein